MLQQQLLLLETWQQQQQQLLLQHLPHPCLYSSSSSSRFKL
jgi:hypothetical protein